MIGVLVDGRYETVKVLGGGTFGQTFLAKDMKRPGQPPCVIKQFRYVNNNPKALEQARRLFKKEAEILEKLGHHDQIPTLLADIEEHQEFYLVEQFVPGQSLGQEVVPGHQWAEAEVIHLLEEVLQVLVFVHGQGVIHRDIKPANLMRRESDGKIVLIDFGAVKELGTQIANPNVPTIAIGTPGYMAIEQFNGLPQLNSDIYALGIVAIQALLGLAADELSGLKDSHSHPPGEVVWRDRRSVSPGLADVLDRMVRADYRQRYQSAETALADLKTLHTEIADPASVSTMLVTPAYEPTIASQPQNSRLVEAHSLPATTSSSAHAAGGGAITVPGTEQPQRQRRWLLALATLLTIGGLTGIGYAQKGRVAEYFYNQGKEQARYGNVKEALDNYTRAIQIEPGYADAYARRCGSRLTLEDDEGAMQDCQRAIDLDSNNAIAYLNWGNLYAEQRDQDNANKNYTRSVELSSRLIQLNQDDADAYYYRGAARFRLADYRGAIEDATQAINHDTDYANAYLTRCQAHGLMGEHEQAIGDCQKATEINPNYYAAFASLCNNLSNAEQHQAALDACTRALQINPNDSHAYNNRGVVWLRLQDYQSAINDYRQAIQRDPKDAVAQHNLGDALSLQGDLQGAIAAYTKAIELNPTFAAAYYGRGIRQAGLNNSDAAVADLQESANLYTQQGRRDRADDALFQIRRIQNAAAAPDSTPSEQPQPEQPQPAPADIPVQEASTSLPSSNPGPAPISDPAPADPVIQEPPAPFYDAPAQPNPPLSSNPPQPDPYVEEPPVPYSAPADPYVEEAPNYPIIADPYVEEAPAPIFQEPGAPPLDLSNPSVEEPVSPPPALEPELRPERLEFVPPNRLPPQRR